jgi:amino acid transporter/mannitol/fructose-specific phosphotransferase system IIA component (Ntr-type)
LSALKPQKRLKKELGLLDVFAIAAGTTLSAGFFLLPGIAAQEAGSAIVLAYLLAAVPLVPAMFSIVELSTAMPRAGGVYYFLDRTMGPLMGTIGGIGTWLALILKVSFALIGMGVYISLFLPEVEIVPIAIGVAVILGIINLFGAHKSGSLQIFLVIILLSVLSAFIFLGLGEIHTEHFSNMFNPGAAKIFSTAGLVYISYVGVTKIASLSEEVKNPERNLPLGIFLALGVAIAIYFAGTTVLVGVVPMEELKGNLSPIATAAGKFMGRTGMMIISAAAIMAFISVANGGALSASRYPLAMSRDHIVPRLFRKLSKGGTPINAVLITVSAIILIILLFDPTGIAKLASAFQLLMFALVCVAVIVMRESKIESYDPGYKSPLYPWMQIFGFIASLFLIAEMGVMPILFSSGLIVLAVIWYLYYVRANVIRTGAIYHIFERLGRKRYAGLDQELRGILKEKGLRRGDPFEAIVARSTVVNLPEKKSFEEVVREAAKIFALIIPHTREEIETRFLEGTRVGATPVAHDIALPHFRSDGLAESQLVLVRAEAGVDISFPDFLADNEMVEKTVHGVFFLVSPVDNPSQHLRILAQIAERVDEDGFVNEWASAETEQEIKEVLLNDDTYLNINISSKMKTGGLIGKELKEIAFEEGCLVAIIHRDGKAFVPKGSTVIREGDRLVVIGEPSGIKTLKEKYCTSF